MKLNSDFFSQFGDESKRHLPPTPPYESLQPPAPKTRSTDTQDTNCSCKICEIARMSGPEYKKHAEKQSNKIGAQKVKISPPAKEKTHF